MLRHASDHADHDVVQFHSAQRGLSAHKLSEPPGVVQIVQPSASIRRGCNVEILILRAILSQDQSHVTIYVAVALVQMWLDA